MKTKPKNTITVAISIIIIVSVAIIYYFGSFPPKIETTELGIETKGMYGDTFLYEDIDDVEILQSLPEIIDRTNGSAFGSILKGHFTTTEYGAVLLFVDADNDEFIRIQLGDTIVIFSLPTSEEIQEVYQLILDNM